MSNPPPPSIPGGTPPPPSIPTPPAAPSVPKAPAAPSVPPASGAPAAPAAPTAPPAAAAPTIPLRPAGLGGGIKLGGGLKTVALGSATTPVAPPAGAAPAAAAPTVPLTPPGAGMATAQLPQATIGLNTPPLRPRSLKKIRKRLPIRCSIFFPSWLLPLRLFSLVINTPRIPWKPAA